MTILRLTPLPSIGDAFEVEAVDWVVRDGCLVVVQEDGDGTRYRTFMPLENLVGFKHCIPYGGV